MVVLKYWPPIAGFVMGLSLGTAFLWCVLISLRRGFVMVNTRIQIIKYPQQNNPVEFWFYIVLFSGAGLAMWWVGFYLLIVADSKRL